MATIFHVSTEAVWKEAEVKGFYETPSLKDEGFIHCCLQEQLEVVLQRYFNGVNDILLLEIETDKLSSPFYYEWSPSSNDTFPHIYGAINLDAVVNTRRHNSVIS